MTLEEELHQIRENYQTGKSLSLEYRKNQLRALCTFLVKEESALVKALEADFKPYFEALSEVRSVQSEVVKAIDQLESWVQPVKVNRTWAFTLDGCTLEPEPLGVVLIISPWNYPISLAIEPLIGAITAGCAAVIKPSEICANVSRLITEHLPVYLDSQLFTVYEGGVDIATRLLDWPKWDLIFYTGNGQVGKQIAQKAATNLIPTVLELGGKSPVIVTKSADLKTCAHRIAFGKWFNAGQTCIAPDYVLTLEELIEPLKNELLAVIKKFWGEEPCESPDYCRVVNDHHWNRLEGLLDSVADYSKAKVGKSDQSKRYFSPTIVINPPRDAKIMQEEIFGPILPILSVESLSDAINFVNARNKPLAAYLFSTDSKEVAKFKSSLSAGGLCINDTVMHVFSALLPLGGVGASGHGRYKGKWSFETFSHFKPTMWRSQGGEFINHRARYPPMTNGKFRLMSAALFNEPKLRKHTL